MNRITATLVELKSRQRKAFSCFVTAGYPSTEATIPVIRALCDNGADMIELGIPFSDPVADGPAIQASSEAALANGINVAKVLDYCRAIRQFSAAPMILMGYANPILSYGPERFMEDAALAGADGIIVPDIPPEESTPYRTAAASRNLSMVFLAAPTTDDARLAMIDSVSSGFLYGVSVTGVTGEQHSLPERASAFLRRARRIVHYNPLLAGFGISSPDDARDIAGLCDGIIVGSALIRELREHRNDPAAAAGAFAARFREALDR